MKILLFLVVRQTASMLLKYGVPDSLGVLLGVLTAIQILKPSIYAGFKA